MASVKLPNVSYIDTLYRVSKERYLAKIDLLCGLDPYANSGKSLAIKLRDARTVTQAAAYWLLPGAMTNIGYHTVQETDFQSRQSMKRKLDESIATGTMVERPSGTSQRLPDVPRPTDAESSAFLAALNDTQDRAVILTVTAEHAERYVPTYFGDKSLPKVMAELYEERCTEMPTEQLHEHCASLFDGITITDVQSKNIEKITRAQSASKEWYLFRAGRVTASRMKAVCSTPLERPSPSLVKTICYPHTTKFSTHATRWGCDHEASALQRYCEVSQTTHTNFTCKESGFTINPNMPYMGASPDSVVSCDCCGIGVVEVKCPYCLRKSVLSDKADSLVVIGGKLQLSKKHAHYYQVQTQLFVCDRKYADYVVWTECDVHIERIERDEQLWNHVEPRAKAFFVQAILPELVGKLFSKPQPSKVHATQDNAMSALYSVSDDGREVPIVICRCRCPYDANERVVCCSNENCEFRWFHLKCLKLKRMPSCKLSWYCPDCKKLPAIKQKKLSKKTTG